MQSFRYTLYVNDIDVSIRFYEQVVGFPVIRRFSQPGMELAFLGTEETRIALVQGKVGQCYCDSVPVGCPVEDLEQKMASVQACGICIHSGPSAPEQDARAFCVADPDGVLVKFIEQRQG